MLIVYTTLPDHDTAHRLACALIEQQLAACVHVGAPLTAVYRWQGSIEQASEIPLAIKTPRACYAAVQTWLREHHPYDVPEIVAVSIHDALPEYLKWVQTEVKTRD